MRFLSPNLLSLAFAAVLAAGCASKPAGENPAERPARIIPPTMIRGPVPEFRQLEPIDAKLEVLVDVNGDPVMNTLVITGTVSGGSRDALHDWIKRSRFNPARQGNVVIASVYKTQVTSSVTVRRVR